MPKIIISLLRPENEGASKIFETFLPIGPGEGEYVLDWTRFELDAETSATVRGTFDASNRGFALVLQVGEEQVFDTGGYVVQNKPIQFGVRVKSLYVEVFFEPDKLPQNALGRVLKWEKISDSPHKTNWLGRCRLSLDHKSLIEAGVEMWHIFLEFVMPLNARTSWDHIRCIFSLDDESLAVFVAKWPFNDIVNGGSCCLEIGNFSEVWIEYKKNQDAAALYAHESSWSQLIVEAAKKVIGNDKNHPLCGVNIEFWNATGGEECVYKIKLANEPTPQP